MYPFIVIVVFDTADPSSPQEVTFFAASARNPQEAEQVVIEKLGRPIRVIASRAVPQSWPSQPGEVVYL